MLLHTDMTSTPSNLPVVQVCECNARSCHMTVVTQASWRHPILACSWVNAPVAATAVGLLLLLLCHGLCLGYLPRLSLAAAAKLAAAPCKPRWHAAVCLELPQR